MLSITAESSQRQEEAIKGSIWDFQPLGVELAHQHFRSKQMDMSATSPQSEVELNFHIRSPLTRMEIKWFRSSRLYKQILNSLLRTTAQWFWGSKRNVSTVFQLLPSQNRSMRKSHFGLACITWCWNYMVWSQTHLLRAWCDFNVCSGRQ